MKPSFTLRYRRWLAFTLFLTFDLIVFGAYVRLSDSGLGCPDWPGCYAKATPWHALAEIKLQEAMIPDGAVTHFKAWVEMIHRYVATLLGMLCIGLLFYSIRGKKALSFSAKLPAFTLFWVCLQGAFGAWTVTLKLMPIIVTAHLLGGLVLLGLLSWQYTRLQPQITLPSAPKNLQTSVILLLAIVTFQIALGGWVSTNYAALACNTFPLCQGALIPDMDFKHGFTLWRDLGVAANGEWLPFQALVAIHWTHRANALIVLIIAVLTMLKLKPFPAFAGYRKGLMCLLTLQIFTGIGSVILNYPLALAVIHTAGAAAIVLLLTRLLATLYYARHTPQVNMPTNT